MTVLEIILIVIGVIMMIGSFFITEKLSQREISDISELSSQELKRILEKSMGSAAKQVEELVDDVIDKSMDIAERALNKETSLKIRAVSEYSDTVMESIQKTHNEVMFLYSMLNDKHSELTEYAGKLQKLKSVMEQLEEDVAVTLADSEEAVRSLSEKAGQVVAAAQIQLQAAASAQPVIAEQDITAEEEPETEQEADLMNHNQSILAMYKQGMSVIEIARQLGLGLGEVKLVIDLYRGEEA